jgi:hypothetical protein
MEQIKKNWLGWVITFLIAFFTVILTNSFGEKSKDKYDLKEKVDNIEIKKADRIELIRHQDYDDKRFDEIRNDYQTGISDLKAEFRDMRKDVIEILKNKK